VSIANPNAEAVNVKLTYMTSTGKQDGPTVNMPAKSQATVYPSSTLGAADFSTKVECLEGRTISVDRTMYWTGTGAACPEAHCATEVTSPATTWYMPEGSSNWGFDFIGAADASIKVTSNVPVIPERAMYWNDRGTGTDTIGGYSDSD
jgi:hypothetical protein